jgi:hypothetical protein
VKPWEFDDLPRKIQKQMFAWYQLMQYEEEERVRNAEAAQRKARNAASKGKTKRF